MKLGSSTKNGGFGVQKPKVGFNGMNSGKISSGKLGNSTLARVIEHRPNTNPNWIDYPSMDPNGHPQQHP